MTKNQVVKNQEEKLFLTHNCLKRKISQLEYTKKIDKKSRKKNRKIIFGSELSKTNNELTFRLHQKMTRNREKKIENLFLGQNFLERIMSQLLNNTKK